MDTNYGTHFFLGSNSPLGFYSLYNDFVSAENGDFLWIIKGGPGCGKSEFMKKIGLAASAAGHDVEYIHCLLAPDTIDGIYIPGLKLAYADGTAPHVMEPLYPAAASLYLDLGAYYDRRSIKSRLGEIADLKKKYEEQLRRVTASVAAAKALLPRDMPGLVGEEERKAVVRRASGAVMRELGKKSARQESRAAAARKSGAIKKRFISAITGDGLIFLENTLKHSCERVYTLDNDYGLACLYLDKLSEAARERGIKTILCPDPLEPEILEAIIFPELSLGFVAISSRRKYSGEAYRHVRLDALIDPAKIKEYRPRYRSAQKLGAELLRDAEGSLSQARRLHDTLEEIYSSSMDFEGINILLKEHIASQIT